MSESSKKVYLLSAFPSEELVYNHVGSQKLDQEGSNEAN